MLEDARIEKRIGLEYIGVFENLSLLRRSLKGAAESLTAHGAELPVLQLCILFALYYLGAVYLAYPSERKRTACCYWLLKKQVSGSFIRYYCRLLDKVPRCRSTRQIFDLTAEILEFFIRGGIPADSGSRKKGSGRTGTGRPGGAKRGRTQGRADGSCGSTAADFKAGMAGLASALSQQGAGAGFARLEEELKQYFKSAGFTAPHDEARQLIESFADRDSTSRDDLGTLRPKLCRPGRRFFINLARNDSYGLRLMLSSKVLAYVQQEQGGARRGLNIDFVRAQLLPLGETRIFRRREETEDFSTSVHLLIDVSGSMVSHDGSSLTRSEIANRCALAIVYAMVDFIDYFSLALEGIDGITTMATFFPGTGRHCELETALRPDERASLAAPRFDQAPRGSTPLAQALWYALDAASRLECARNIVIALTDGGPDSPAMAAAAVQALKAAGVELYGIGIKQPRIKAIIEHSVVIDRAEDLRSAMLNLILGLFELGPGAYS